MAAVTRELKIDYGGFIVGLTTDRVITGKMEIEESYETAVVSFEFGIQKDTEAAFVAEIALVEAAFSKPRLKLTIMQGSGLIKEFDPTKATDKNTGFNADPVITKRQDVGDTGRSRVYGVTVTFDMPADIATQQARRDRRTVFGLDASNVGTIELTGTYTAFDNKDAREQFDDNIAALITVITTTFGSGGDRIYEEVERRIDLDETDKILDFAIRLKEIRYPQSKTLTDELSMVSQSILVKRTDDNSGDSPGGPTGVIESFSTKSKEAVKAKRLIRLEVNYQVNINIPSGSLVRSSKQIENDYKNFYLKISRPWIIESAKALDVSVVAIVGEDVEPDPATGVIRARVSILATEGGKRGVTGGNRGKGVKIIEFELTEKIHEESGLVLVPVWDGDRFSRLVFQGPGRRIRTRTERYRALGEANIDELFGTFSLKPVEDTWWPVSQDTQAIPLFLGSKGSKGSKGDGTSIIKVTDIINELIWEFGKRKNASAKKGKGSGRTGSRR